MTRPIPLVASTDDDPAPERNPSEFSAPQAGPPPVPPEPKAATIADFFGLEAEHATDEQIQDLAIQILATEIAKNPLSAKFNVLVLFDENSILRKTSNRIYSALSAIDTGKPILLILNTPGGDVAAAYLISKLCREHTAASFEVAVPRRAKSAGTLICCGADKIHMGSLSELGPIDPQFGAVPALALKHSVEHIAELVGIYPGASQMFSDYLSKSLRVEALGYFERVAKSAAQYAERLLDSKAVKSAERSSAQIAKHLVYAYKDHGFVIDAREAKAIFGESAVDSNTDEYKFANAIYEVLDFMAWICDKRFSREFSYVGGTKQGCCWVFAKKS